MAKMPNPYFLILIIGLILLSGCSASGCEESKTGNYWCDDGSFGASWGSHSYQYCNNNITQIEQHNAYVEYQIRNRLPYTAIGLECYGNNSRNCNNGKCDILFEEGDN